MHRQIRTQSDLYCLQYGILPAPLRLIQTFFFVELFFLILMFDILTLPQGVFGAQLMLTTGRSFQEVELYMYVLLRINIYMRYFNDDRFQLTQ